MSSLLSRVYVSKNQEVKGIFAFVQDCLLVLSNWGVLYINPKRGSERGKTKEKLHGEWIEWGKLPLMEEEQVGIEIKVLRTYLWANHIKINEKFSRIMLHDEHMASF